MIWLSLFPDAQFIPNYCGSLPTNLHVKSFCSSGYLWSSVAKAHLSYVCIFSKSCRMFSIYCQISMWLTWSRPFQVNLQCHVSFAGVAGVFISIAFFIDCWFMPLTCSKNKWYDVGYLSFFRDPECNCSPQPDQQQGEIQFLNFTLICCFNTKQHINKLILLIGFWVQIYFRNKIQWLKHLLSPYLHL